MTTDFKEYFRASWPMEAVGCLKDGAFIPLENLATETHAFRVEPAQVAAIKPDALLHSHTAGVHPHVQFDLLKSPSKKDMEQQQAMGIKWGICVTDGAICEDPVYFGSLDDRPPYEGREFIWNVNDCWEMVRDWFHIEKGVDLPTPPRDPLWSNGHVDFIDGFYDVYGFTKVPLKDMQHGDVLMYSVRSKFINHLGLFLGNNEVLGHWAGRISCIEPFGKWGSHVAAVARYNK